MRKSLKIIIILLFKTTYRTDINLCSISITKLNMFLRETILSQFKIENIPVCETVWTVENAMEI